MEGAFVKLSFMLVPVTLVMPPCAWAFASLAIAICHAMPYAMPYSDCVVFHSRFTLLNAWLIFGHAPKS